MTDRSDDVTRQRPLALITGPTAGLGLEFARQLAQSGHDLILIARDAERLNAVAEQLRGASGTIVDVISADLSTESGTATACDAITARAPDVVVHNAGFGTRGVVARTDDAAQRAMVALHVVATDRLMRTAVRDMVPRRHGALIVVSSVASWTISAGNVNYGATKTYQRIYMEALALELAGTGVYAQALCPGFTHTEFHQRAAMDMRGIPSWAWLSAEDVVSASLRAMRARSPVVVIPKTRWRLIVAALQLTPRWLLRRLARRYAGTRT